MPNQPYLHAILISNRVHKKRIFVSEEKKRHSPFQQNLTQFCLLSQKRKNYCQRDNHANFLLIKSPKKSPIPREKNISKKLIKNYFLKNHYTLIKIEKTNFHYKYSPPIGFFLLLYIQTRGSTKKG